MNSVTKLEKELILFCNKDVFGGGSVANHIQDFGKSTYSGVSRVIPGGTEQTALLVIF